MSEPKNTTDTTDTTDTTNTSATTNTTNTSTDNPFCLACLNCASGACCPPGSPAAHKFRVAQLCALGADEALAVKMSNGMLANGVAMVSQELVDAISKFVDHPGRHTG